MIEHRSSKPLGMDAPTERAVRTFLSMLEDRYSVQRSILYGSRARHSHDVESDADLAVVLKGAPGHRGAVARDMAGIAFDAMLESGILVEALPLWESDFEHPDAFGNPALLRTIRRDGVQVSTDS